MASKKQNAEATGKATGNAKGKGKGKAAKAPAPKLTKAQQRARLAAVRAEMDKHRADWKLYQQYRSEVNATSGEKREAAKKRQEGKRKAYSAYKRAYAEDIQLRKALGEPVRKMTRGAKQGNGAEGAAAAAPAATDGKATDEAPATAGVEA